MNGDKEVRSCWMSEMYDGSSCHTTGIYVPYNLEGKWKYIYFGREGKMVIHEEGKIKLRNTGTVIYRSITNLQNIY